MLTLEKAEFQHKKLTSILTKEELDRIEEAFSMFITDTTTDTVKPWDIVKWMKKNHLSSLMEELNTPENNARGITFDYFIDFLIQTYNSSEKESIKRRFELFDIEKRGYIEFDRLAQIADELGLGLLKDEALLMFERASSDKEKITFDDFYFTMTQIKNRSKEKSQSDQATAALNNTNSFTNILP